jgi:RNA polymerase sigma-70 factor (ECF subfamily)
MRSASPAISTDEPSFVTSPPGFQDLYERYADAVYQTALRVTGNPADAEDVLQTVFLRVLDHQLTMDPLWSPERYLRRAATNAAIDILRRRANLAETGMEESRGARESTVFLKEQLRRAIAKLPAQSAELFVLCYLEGYSYDELADQFQLERGTIASRLHRIRAALQKDFSD